MNIHYIGEQPLWGQIGHLFVVIACITAVFSVIANVLRVRDHQLEPGWKITARWLYTIHAISVFGIFITLLLMIYNHRFEYQYVWQHSKRGMSMKFILACIWEGQEGSTLLWLIWHSVIGLILMRRAKEWEAPVMSVISLVQVFLSVMLLGVYFGHVHIGSNPFELIRQREENIGLPWTNLPDYLSRIPLFQNGRGLNPLLQNYWMVIHPPTLFCGFALTTVPFAFAIAGLWTKRYHDWQKAALPWAFTGVLVLGTGILMGGAWAYESLSFGGFWAWDPVENASLVPWLTLVGAAHVMLLYKQRGQSLFTTFLLCIFAFLLVVYSTFLTKSGILGKTSVHAFTDDGLNEELTAFMGFFLWLGVVLLSMNTMLRIVYTTVAFIVLLMFLNGMHGASMLVLMIASLATLFVAYFKYFPKQKEEEELWSREFWMFIGSLVFVMASFQIIFYTSSPVVNKFLQIGPIHDFFTWLHDHFPGNGTAKLMNANIAPAPETENRSEIIYFFNKWQIPFAAVVCLLAAVTQFFKYKKTSFKEFGSKITRSLIISAVITLPFILLVYFNSGFALLSDDKQATLLRCSFLAFAAIWCIVANTDYFIRMVKGKFKKGGASIAHAGFGILLFGAMLSTSKKDIISQNSSHVDITKLSNKASNGENIFLKKNDTLPMGDYLVTYSQRQREIRNGTPYIIFTVDFLEKNSEGKIEKDFSLHPFIQLNDIMGNAAEPDTRHFLYKDVYTFVKFPSNNALEDSATTVANAELYSSPHNNTLREKDTIVFDNCLAILDSVRGLREGDTANYYHLGAYFSIYDTPTHRKETLLTKFIANKKTNEMQEVPAVDDTLGIKLTFWNVSMPKGIDVYASIKNSKKMDFIVMEAVVFPGINILWIGCLIMMTGTFIAIRERIRERKRDKAAGSPQ